MREANAEDRDVVSVAHDEKTWKGGVISGALC